MKNTIFKSATVILLTCVIMACSSINVKAAPKKMADGTLFDAEFYANTYPDVKAVLGNDENALHNHYVQFGKSEGRKATASATTPAETFQDDFDPVFYANTYPDVKAAFGTDENALYNHYITYGKKEGRKPNGKDSQTTSSKPYSLDSNMATVTLANGQTSEPFPLVNFYRDSYLEGVLQQALDIKLYYAGNTRESQLDVFWNEFIAKPFTTRYNQYQLYNNRTNAPARTATAGFIESVFSRGYCTEHYDEAKKNGWISADFVLK